MGGCGLVGPLVDHDGAVQVDPATSTVSRAQGYFAMAECYVVAVEGLVEKAEMVSTPFHMMVGHALELSLKAVLAHAGRDEELLVMAGHNLGYCQREARSEGFSGRAAEGLAALVDTLDRPHADQRFRYPTVFGGTQHVAAADAAATLRLHLEDVRAWLC